MPGYPNIRHVGERLIARLKRRATRLGQSAEAAVRDGLRLVPEGENGTEFDRLAAELRAATASRKHTLAQELQREGRDER